MRGNDALDFSLYTKAMIDEQKEKAHEASESTQSLFSRKPLLQISKLRLGKQQSKHIKENKLSEKMGRRDIQFYDLYKLDKQPNDVEKLQDKGFLLDGILKGEYLDEKTGKTVQIVDEEEPIYGDLEVDDFNKLFRNKNLIKDRFG